MKQIINQIFELETRLKEDQNNNYDRIINNLKNGLQDEGYTWHNPLGEKYTETRTDCDASITGKINNELYITQVIKPVIYKNDDGNRNIIQKAIVIVEGK